MSAPPGLELAGCRHRPRWARELVVWTLDARAGEVVHLRSPNGSGKSTFLSAVVDLSPATWAVRRLGEHRLRTREARLVPSAAGLSADLRLRDHAGLLGERWGLDQDQVTCALERWGLATRTNVPGASLSHGLQRRALLGLALASEPTVVLLDEPSLGLDQSALGLLVAEVARCVERGAIVLLASHDDTLTARLGGRAADPGRQR